MSSPSVLSVANQFPAPSETFVLRKLIRLQEAGFDVSVAASKFGPDAAATGFGLVPMQPWRDLRGSWDALGGAGSVAVAGGLVRSQLHRDGATDAKQRLLLAPLATAEADIVHFEFSGIAVAYRHLLDQLKPAKLVVSCRGSAEQIRPRTDRARAAALGEVFAKVDLIHCVSEAMARTVQGFGAPADKILVVRPAVPVAELAALAERRTPHDGPLRVLAIGRLQWVKGFDDAIRAVARLARAGRTVELRIVGEGPDREKLDFLIDELGLQGSVTLLGVCTQAEVKEQLVWADAMVLSSFSEGISNAVLEAMASGLPVVSTDCGGMAEVIDPGVDGLLVGVGEIDELAEALGQLAGDPALRARLGAAAGARAVGAFDLERQIGEFVGAYRGLLGLPVG